MADDAVNHQIPVHKPAAPNDVPGSLLARLKRHYIKPGAPLPGGIFLPEVGWNGGNAMAGGCDALYVGFTSTSGRILVGHELKTSRADWLRELSKPYKSDGWADECHQWWLVVTDPGIVKGGELPAGWGLMSPGKSVTRMTVHAKPDTKPFSHQPSWRAVRSIMARQDTLRSQAIVAARGKAERDFGQQVEKQVRERIALKLADLEHADRRIVDRDGRLRQLTQALGVTVKWDDGPVYPNQATLDEVREVGEVLRQSRSVKRAVGVLAGYTNLDALRRVEQQASTLRDTLTELKETPAAVSE